jgi:hypothetical protein
MIYLIIIFIVIDCFPNIFFASKITDKFLYTNEFKQILSNPILKIFFIVLISFILPPYVIG